MINLIKKLFKSEKGESLVELLVAIGLASLLIPAILTGIAASRGGRAQQDQRVQAVSILKDSQEAVRSIEQKGWAGVATNGTFHPVISGSSWTLSSGATTSNGFTTSVVITDAQRNSSGAIVASGGTPDPSTKKVVTTVSWTDPINSQVSATSYFSRNKNTAYSETTETQFNNGIKANTQVTNTAGGEVKLINNNKAKWCSPAFSSATIDLPDGPPVAVAATASSVSINTPNDAYVAVSPNTTNSIKLAHVNVTANTDPPVTTLRGKFTLNPTEYSNAGLVPTSLGIDNNFKTTDVKYYKSSGGNTYALLGTNLPNKEVIAVQVNDGNDSANGEFQDFTNKIYKYKTFFNTKIYSSYTSPTDTGFLNPSANSTDAGGDGNGFDSNPTRAYSDNASFAVDNNSGNGTSTNCTGSDKDKHRFYNYNIDVPTGANIDGIEVRLDAKVDSTTGSPKSCVQLSWDGGVTWTTAKTTPNFTTSEVSYTLGSSSDTWGHSWTQSELSNSNFRVRVINVASDNARDFSLDWAPVKVYYTENNFDRSPYDYGAESIAVEGDRGYVASGGYLYVFNLANIDSKSAGSGLDMVGCRIQIDGYDCRATAPNGEIEKYGAGETGATWSDSGTPPNPTCSDGGNTELFATNDIYPVKVGSNTYVYIAIGSATNPEFGIVNVTNVPDGSTSPSISNNSCGRSSGGNSGWKQISSLDFNSKTNTEEAANSVFAKSDGTRAYISSNGGIDANNDGTPDSKQFYVINTTDKTSPAFLAGGPGSPSYGPTSGFYYGTGANSQLFPRRSLTVLNGDRVVLVGSDGKSDGSDAQEYQVLNSETETSPAYCAGLNFDQGFNDLTSVSEADTDNFVYMVANTTVNELKIIEGGPDNALFANSGSFESQVFNATQESMFNRFFATSTVPSNTTLKYQVAITDPVGGSCSSATYSYVGPDGTNSSFFSSAGELPRSNDGTGYENAGQCMRYKVFMTSSDQTQTPVLYDFGVNYSL